MIVEYNEIYEKEVKELLEELQNYIVSIDKENYNTLTKNYKEEYFKKTMEEINKYEGKMFLLKRNQKIVGLITGLINNEEIDTYDFKCPKRGRITELIVSEEERNTGAGTLLLKSMEQYLKNLGCEDILIGVFGYNKDAIEFYKKNNYHTRYIEMTKKELE